MFHTYLDFEIQITSLGPGNYYVRVSGPGGDASATLTIATNDAAYQALAHRLQRLDTDEASLIDLGRMLFHALFQGAIRDVYIRSQGLLQPDQGLRLRLNIDPTATTIAALPWEFLADPDRGPIALRDAPIVRYLPQQAAIPKLAALLPLQVLLTSAETSPPVNIRQELEEIQATFAALKEEIQVTIEPHLTRQKLLRHLRTGFHIWHFVGHGGFTADGRSGTLILEDTLGDPAPITATELGVMLDRSSLRLVVLDACDSAKLMMDPLKSIAPALVHAQIPAVVAMQFPVPAETTQAFASEFYQALVEGYSIDACVTAGRRAVMGVTGLGRPDWGIPVLYTRAHDGVLFDTTRPNRKTNRTLFAEQSSLTPSLSPHEPAAPTHTDVLDIPLQITHTSVDDDLNHESAPFIVGPPIHHPRAFFGREREMKRIFALLKKRPLQNTAIIGMRRSGKTSLLHYLRRITRIPQAHLRANQRNDWLPTPEAYRWIYIDFQDPRFSHADTVLNYLLTGFGLGEVPSCNMDQFLNRAAGHIQTPTIVLFDELGVALERYPELDNRFWEGLRALATNQAAGNLAFILASHSSPVQLAQNTGHSSPFFNIFGYVATLGPLMDSEARAFITSSPIPFNEEDTEWIVIQSQRWPILLQLLCQERLVSLQEDETDSTWRERALVQIEQYRHLLARHESK